MSINNADDNRISLRMEPQLTPVRLEDKLDVHAEVNVAVNSHLTGLGVAGIVALVAGFVSLVLGVLMFIIGWPDHWFGLNGVSWESSRGFIKGVVCLAGLGLILIIFGYATFNYGRTVLGSGSVDQFNIKDAGGDA